MAASIPDASPRVLCVGEVLIVLVQRDAGPLEDAAVFDRSLAGAEANVAIALAAQGTHAGVLTAVGDDGFGRYALRTLAQFGVDVDAAIVDDAHPTGLYVKEVGSGAPGEGNLGAGRSAMHYYRRGSAASALTPAALDDAAVAAAIEAARIIHLTGITPALSETALHTQRLLIERSRGHALVSFDVNWRPALWRGREDVGRGILTDLARDCDVLFVGRDEADEVFGQSDPDRLRALFPHPRRLIVKNDGGAATGFDGARRVDLAPARAEVVEAIGAGDAFAAGVLAGVAADAPMEDCLHRGHRIAAAALSTSGDHVGTRGPA